MLVMPAELKRNESHREIQENTGGENLWTGNLNERKMRFVEEGGVPALEI